MASGFKIRWTVHALSELSDTIQYFEENWTERELILFSNAIDNTVEIISRHPEVYPASHKEKNIRKAVVNKNNTSYYRVPPKTILLREQPFL